MTQTVSITKVPDAKVDEVKGAYIHLGATVTVVENGDGTATVTAVFPVASATTAATHAASSLEASAGAGVTSQLLFLHD